MSSNDEQPIPVGDAEEERYRLLPDIVVQVIINDPAPQTTQALIDDAVALAHRMLPQVEQLPP